MKKLFIVWTMLCCIMALCAAGVGVAFAGESVFRTLHTGDWFNIGTAVVAGFSFLANLTRTDLDNRAVGVVSKIINLFAMNFKRSGL